MTLTHRVNVMSQGHFFIVKTLLDQRLSAIVQFFHQLGGYKSRLDFVSTSRGLIPPLPVNRHAGRQQGAGQDEADRAQPVFVGLTGLWQAVAQA